ncbi:MAG: ferredoxin family protein [bacterium]|nr:ferredoxin family protein [bacterium]
MVDESWIWAGALSLAGVIIVGYLAGFRRRNRRDAQRLREARRLGIERPAAQYPWIAPARCVGCASCVGACPEGDVLGIVGGMAVVVNGLRCVGHGHCEAACAIGAITIGLGDLKKRRDIPLTDEWNESLPSASWW